MKSINDQIEDVFFAYLTDRDISNETKLVTLERQRESTGIGYTDYYNGLINLADKFLMEFERIHESKKENLYFFKKITKDQVEAILTEKNLGIPLHQYTNGRLNGFYRYNEAKKDKEFFKKALENAQIKDIKETVNTAKGLLQEYIDKIAPEPQPSNDKLKKNAPSHFSRELTDKNLNQLYKGLLGTYIPDNTEYEHFKYVFNGGEKPANYKRITWIGTQSLLARLISNIIGDSCDQSNIWKITAECFLYKGHAPNTNTMKKDTSNFNKYEKEPNSQHKKIDAICRF